MNKLNLVYIYCLVGILFDQLTTYIGLSYLNVTELNPIPYIIHANTLYGTYILTIISLGIITIVYLLCKKYMKNEGDKQFAVLLMFVAGTVRILFPIWNIYVIVSLWSVL